MLTGQEAGWYPSPDVGREGQEQYWDGEKWLPSWRPSQAAPVWLLRSIVGMAAAAAVAVIVLIVIAVSSNKSNDDTGTTSQAPTSIDTNLGPAAGGGSTAPYDFDGHGANVDAKRFGKAWPLTIKAGRVNCIPLTAGGEKLTMVVFTADNGTRYALNGTARERIQEMGFKDVTGIWADDPGTGGLKKDISVLIDVCQPVMDR